MAQQVTEHEITPFRSEEENQALGKHPHALDFQFSPEDLAFLDKNGYVVVKGLFSEETCEQMKKEVFERAHTLMGVEKDNHTTWDVLNEPHLTVSIDRVCLNAPTVVFDSEGKMIADFPERRKQIFHIHNDMNLWDLSENKYQAGIALNDCPTGGFQCIPGFHKLEDIKRYREDYENGKFGEHRVPAEDETFVWFRDQEAIDKRAIQVPMEKGDMVIWSARLPHSAMPNMSAEWRIQCYIRMIPTAKHETYTAEVARSSREGFKPRLFSTSNATGDVNFAWEVPLHKAPSPSWLGERLLGWKPWTAAAE
ncbi:PhytanoylCoA dioxygenase (PhyH) superfamily protein [Acanthamoeba castellanii str. Neff]|uniref:PhytanoylCoA dioxygenase (PhyH) superfamily protein n=1 Tax=Acanthamoeba castellanii (strain ATCC 30010 / Neff) TaxID=1257118 RepID=L8GK68_ACACF|nr:PhytanoylCoA dioxygenase (PhyH) superfamily protein [Acanthamoeba castellanii str. Neff]ELR13480.1 PhytanoylCoA dioxygenase (PhyH) superfamily protein [Acanthamoeba castellanii str. Neff]